MHFASPWAFLILLIIPVMIWRRYHRGRTGAVSFSSTDNAMKAGRSLRQRLLGIPFMLRILALILLTIALARPQEGKEQVRDLSKGIAIEMVVDRSGSMGAEMEYGRERLTRLDAVKRVFEEFVLGNNRDLPGRPNDLIGMIAFARYPDTICPLSLAHGALSQFLESVRLVQRQNEDGTAIGDALALAAARLKTAEETVARQTLRPVRPGSPQAGSGQAGKTDKKYEIKSKIIILLTDGENNAGKRAPMQAAKLAAKWGIKIYAIGVGGDEAVATMQTPFGVYKVPIGRGVDRASLEALAKETGGIYRLAEDAKSLHAIYKEIDRLEKSEVESIRYMDYREIFTPYALAAVVLLFIETALGCTVFRRNP